MTEAREPKHIFVCFDKNMERRVFSMRESAQHVAVGDIEEYVEVVPVLQETV